MRITCFVSYHFHYCLVHAFSAQMSEQRQSYFDQGYKKAMRELLPQRDGVRMRNMKRICIIMDGVAGIRMGHFWIKRAAERRYVTAIKALERIDRQRK